MILFRPETLTLLFRLPTLFVLLLRSQAVGYVVFVLVLRTHPLGEVVLDTAPGGIGIACKYLGPRFSEPGSLRRETLRITFGAT